MSLEALDDDSLRRVFHYVALSHSPDAQSSGWDDEPDATARLRPCLALSKRLSPVVQGSLGTYVVLVSCPGDKSLWKYAAALQEGQVEASSCLRLEVKISHSSQLRALDRFGVAPDNEHLCSILDKLKCLRYFRLFDRGGLHDNGLGQLEAKLCDLPELRTWDIVLPSNGLRQSSFRHLAASSKRLSHVSCSTASFCTFVPTAPLSGLRSLHVMLESYHGKQWEAVLEGHRDSLRDVFVTFGRGWDSLVDALWTLKPVGQRLQRFGFTQYRFSYSAAPEKAKVDESLMEELAVITPNLRILELRDISMTRSSLLALPADLRALTLEEVDILEPKEDGPTFWSNLMRAPCAKRLRCVYLRVQTGTEENLRLRSWVEEHGWAWRDSRTMSDEDIEPLFA